MVGMRAGGGEQRVDGSAKVVGVDGGAGGPSTPGVEGVAPLLQSGIWLSCGGLGERRGSDGAGRCGRRWRWLTPACTARRAGVLPLVLGRVGGWPTGRGCRRRRARGVPAVAVGVRCGRGAIRRRRVHGWLGQLELRRRRAAGDARAWPRRHGRARLRRRRRAVEPLTFGRQLGLAGLGGGKVGPRLAAQRLEPVRDRATRRCDGRASGSWPRVSSARVRRWVTAGMSARSRARMPSRTSRASATSSLSVTTQSRFSSRPRVAATYRPRRVVTGEAGRWRGRRCRIGSRARSRRSRGGRARGRSRRAA